MAQTCASGRQGPGYQCVISKARFLHAAPLAGAQTLGQQSIWRVDKTDDRKVAAQVVRVQDPATSVIGGCLLWISASRDGAELMG